MNSAATKLTIAPAPQPPAFAPAARPAPVLAADVGPRIAKSVQTRVEKGLHRCEFFAMGTQCRVNAHGMSEGPIRDFQREVIAWVTAFEAKYSRFIADSLIGRINAAAGDHWVATDPETDRLFQLCQELFFFTRGSFDPSALPLIQLWNWKQASPSVPSAEAIRVARELVGWNKVQRRPGGIFLPQPGMAIDLGGIGKEYAVDCVINLALQRGIPHVLVDFGQDVRVRGHAPDKQFWGIGLDDPASPGKPWVGLPLTDHAVATSGDYVRHFVANGVRYGHIIDPRTGYPALNDVRAVSVVAPSCTIAGLLATSACILGPEEGLRLLEMHPGAAGAITTNNTRLYTRKFHEFIPA